MNAIPETTTPPADSLKRLVSLREKAETSLHHWRRIREDCYRADHRQNCDFQICWLRGYLRALDDTIGEQANDKLCREAGRKEALE